MLVTPVERFDRYRFAGHLGLRRFLSLSEHPTCRAITLSPSPARAMTRIFTRQLGDFRFPGVVVHDNPSLRRGRTTLERGELHGDDVWGRCGARLQQVVEDGLAGTPLQRRIIDYRAGDGDGRLAALRHCRAAH